MSQIITLNGRPLDLDYEPSLVVGTKPLWRTPPIINSRMQHGVAINGYSYPPCEDGTILYLPGLPGQGSTIWDRSKEGNDGTIGGATWKRLSRGLGHLYFDDTNDYVDFSASISTFSSLTVGTVEAWFKVPSVVLDNRNLFTVSHSADASSDWGIYLDSVAGKYITVTHREGGTQLRFIDDTDVADNVWHHLAVWVGVSSNGMVLDGVVITPTYTTGDATTQKFFADVLTADKIGLGRGYDSGGGERFWGGDIALPRIYNLALSATEILNHFNQERHLFGV